MREEMEVVMGVKPWVMAYARSPPRWEFGTNVCPVLAGFVPSTSNKARHEIGKQQPAESKFDCPKGGLGPA